MCRNLRSPDSLARLWFVVVQSKVFAWALQGRQRQQL
jgi:hypothetical protein